MEGYNMEGYKMEDYKYISLGGWCGTRIALDQQKKNK
jgi:hypothetical protein